MIIMSLAQDLQTLDNLGTVYNAESHRDYLITSHSIDGTFESCPRRFEFRHVLGQVPDVDESGFAADAGTAMHEALQQWCRTGRVEDGYLTLMRWWPWHAEDTRLRKDSRNFEQATLLLKMLMEDKFWDDWEVATLPSGDKAIELAYRINHHSLGTFQHPRTGRETYLADQGKIDFIVRHKRTGVLMVLDLKTTTYDESLHEAAFRFSGQGGGYGAVMSTAVGHDFRQHGIRVCYLLAEFGPLGPVVRPFEYEISPDEVEDFIITKRLRLERMLAFARADYWPRRQHGCVFYKTPCGYLDVCHRRDKKFLLDWFAAESDRFKFKERIYEPYWILEG